MRRLPFAPRLLALVLLATLSLPAAAGERAGLFHPQTFTLDNGLEVVLIENQRAPAVVQMLWYRVGAADEPPGTSGIAHFVEHLMFRGSEAVGDGEFSRIVRREGGRDNAFTSWDFTGYHQTVAPDRLELVMKLEADRMANLVITDAVVEPERAVILEERGEVVDSRPGAQFGEQMRNALFQSHPYGIPIIGWEHEMRGLSRDDAIDFYRQWYGPNNAILVVAGPVDLETLRELAERHYGPIPAVELPERRRPQEPPPRAPRRLVMEHPEVSQPSWQRQYLAPSFGNDESITPYALQVLSTILSDGQIGRLYEALVVDRDIATAAGAWYDPHAIDDGVFGLFASPKAGGDPAEVEAAIDEEIARLLADGVEEDEVADAVRRMRAETIFALDGLGAGARIMGRALVIGRGVEHVETWAERIGEVGADDVNEAARLVLESKAQVTGALMPATRREAVR